MPISRFSIAFKALRQLGFSQVALNAVYKFGLASGHYRRAIRPPLPLKGLQLRAVMPIPTREQVLLALGENGLRALYSEAGEIVNGQFRQFGAAPVDIRLGFDEPLQPWTAYETHKAELPNRDFAQPDIKFIWEPARFGWAFVLGRAYHCSRDEKYAQAFWRLFEIFNAGNPPYQGPNWMSAQEVGLRLMALVWAGQIFDGSQHSTAPRREALVNATAAHAARIPATLVYARSQNNNHLLTEAASLYTAGLALPAHPQAAQWRATGQKWLGWCFRSQIDARGEYVQHSANYQRLMLQTALWVNALNPKEAGSFAATIRNDRQVQENLALATHWLLSLLDPESGQVPNLGANDGALIFPLSGGAFNDFRPVAESAARAFLGVGLLPGSLDEMPLWFGLAEVMRQDETGRYPGEHIYAAHSWGYLRAVQYKSRPSHADQLHFDLWWRGLNITPDAGTYLYNGQPPWDNRLTSTLAHNTVSVDGQEQMTRAGRFLYLDWAGAGSKQYFQSGAAYIQCVSAETDAYRRLGVRHQRKVTVFNDERWLVEDELFSALISGKKTGLHTYRLHWLLPDWEWRLDRQEKQVVIGLDSAQGGLKLVISTREPIKRVGLIRAGQLLLGDGLVSPVFGWVSPTYAVKEPALSLAIEVESEKDATFGSKFIFPTH